MYYPPLHQQIRKPRDQHPASAVEAVYQLAEALMAVEAALNVIPDLRKYADRGYLSAGDIEGLFDHPVYLADTNSLGKTLTEYADAWQEDLDREVEDNSQFGVGA
jgi:hypothetical protein